MQSFIKRLRTSTTEKKQEAGAYVPIVADYSAMISAGLWGPIQALILQDKEYHGRRFMNEAIRGGNTSLLLMVFSSFSARDLPVTVEDLRLVASLPGGQESVVKLLSERSNRLRDVFPKDSTERIRLEKRTSLFPEVSAADIKFILYRR